MEMETRAERTSSGKGWRDHLGFVGPYQPGVGPRSDPKQGQQPTGPAIGERLPDIVASGPGGRVIDAHRERNGGPLIAVFYRSATW